MRCLVLIILPSAFGKAAWMPFIMKVYGLCTKCAVFIQSSRKAENYLIKRTSLLKISDPGGGSGDPGSGDALSQLRWVWGHLEDLTLHTSLSFLMFKIRGKGYINQQA